MMTYTQLSNQEPYLIIHADGKITASEKLQPSETAARVLECMKTQWMEDSQSKQIRELQERIKRLEEALTEIELAMKQPASNHRLMQISGPARQVINIIKKAKEDKP
jgi:hypothetical protein